MQPSLSIKGLSRIARCLSALALPIAMLITLEVFAPTIEVLAQQRKVRQTATQKRAFAPVTVTALNLPEGENIIAPGRRFDISADLFLAKSWNDQGRTELVIGWYLLPIDSPIASDAGAIPIQPILRSGTFIGQSGIRGIPTGKSSHNFRFPVVSSLPGIEGEYRLVSILDPLSKIYPSTFGRRGYVAPFTVTIKPLQAQLNTVEIASFTPDTMAFVPVGDERTFLEGTIALDSIGGASSDLSVSICAVPASANSDTCQPLEILNPKDGTYGSAYPVDTIAHDDTVTTMYRALLPIELANGDISLKAQVWRGKAYEGEPLDTRERVVSAERAPMVFQRTMTDFERERERQLALARRALKKQRIRGSIVDPIRVAALRRSGERPLDLDALLTSITRNPKLASLSRISVEDSFSAPPGLVNSIPGSRFNMPDQDFPWLNNIGVTAPPPPEMYQGRPFPNKEQFTRCIPFFCGPNSPAEAGREPSQSCVLQYCGSTLEDINFGGRNPNLIDEQMGFDKNFSGGGFGARVGVKGRAKVYHDRVISDYVAASYEAGAFFGVKLFGFSLPIFDANSQTVYSPTEILSSQTKNELKILGLVIERENKPSQGLSLVISKTYGVEKNADVGLGPISVDVEVEAGGTGGLRLAVEQIDVLRGIVGSLTPSARCGAAARALTDVGIGRFGIEGSLDLFEDSVPVTATFNVGLDISRKTVTPQLDFDIRNILEGPKGRIKLLLEIDLGLFTESFSTTLASFSTGRFETPIYDKTTTFGSVRYPLN